MSGVGGLLTEGSWLARRNPTVKVATLLMISLAVLVIFDPWPVLVLYLMALTAARVLAAVPWRTLALAQIPFLAFAIGLVSVNALSRPGVELWPDGPLRITVEGLTIGAALALRGLLIGVLTIGFLASTPPRELMVSLIEHARLSPRYAYAILAGHRMLAAMPARWATIRNAQAVRASLTTKGEPRFAVRDAARCAFALLVDSIRASERTSVALESRGLGRAVEPGQSARTIWRPVALDRRDVLVAVVPSVTLALALVLHLRL